MVFTCTEQCTLKRFTRHQHLHVLSLSVNLLTVEANKKNSDNGTNLHDPERELRKEVQKINWNQIENEAVSKLSG